MNTSINDTMKLKQKNIKKGYYKTTKCHTCVLYMCKHVLFHHHISDLSCDTSTLSQFCSCDVG